MLRGPRVLGMMTFVTAFPRESLMEWTAPTFVEIKMDAEIGSYQADEEPNTPIVEAGTPVDASVE